MPSRPDSELVQTIKSVKSMKDVLAKHADVIETLDARLSAVEDRLRALEAKAASP